MYRLKINCMGKRTVGKGNKRINVENIIVLKIKIIKKKKNERRKKEKKENFTEVYNNNKMCDWIYAYTYMSISKVKTVHKKKKYNRLIWWTKETRNYIY